MKRLTAFWRSLGTRNRSLILKRVKILLALIIVNIVIHIGGPILAEHAKGDRSFKSEQLNLKFKAPKEIYLASRQYLDEINADGDPFVTHMFACTMDDSVTITIYTHTPEPSEMSAEEYLLEQCDQRVNNFRSVELAGETYADGFVGAKDDSLKLEFFCRKTGDTFINICFLYEEWVDIEKVYNSFSSYW